MTTTTEIKRYNGWKNYETWNCALWISNDEGLYNLAREVVERNRKTPYTDFVNALDGSGNISVRTPDGVCWLSSKVSRSELNNMMRELVSED